MVPPAGISKGAGDLPVEAVTPRTSSRVDKLDSNFNSFRDEMKARFSSLLGVVEGRKAPPTAHSTLVTDSTLPTEGRG